ncbi:hypothetical protein AN640_07245 [Candidatus Epulonipiscium fishelsonii]|uniref:Uncharacterized protein n=1 Tax=Candidatus Epulonipiscium fishelsonii TaxID=77094 RepID=A0ACC8XGE8_9FIRM|nr:hypothetical protein AN640_07245 [Epulopiscium sp. SCG-D08WGA-EpuloA1]
MNYEKFLEQILEIKDSLADDVSKEIFDDIFLRKIDPKIDKMRLLKNMSNKTLYIEPIATLIEDPSYKQRLNVLNKYNKLSLEENIVLFGVDKSTLNFFKLFGLDQANNLVICTKDLTPQNISLLETCKKPIISYEDLILHYRDYRFIVLSSQPINELIYIGFNTNDIWKFAHFDPYQYFDDIVKLSQNEVFVDLGGLTGETSIEFAKRTNYTYKQIYIFEPDPLNYEKTINNIDNLNLKNVEVFNLGGWSEKDTLSFASNGTGQSKIDNEGTYKINVDSLDNVLGDTPVTFIKMDIEGAELEALIGAKEIIKKYKPQLAISIYHKPEDIFEIPLYIKSLVPEYKFYIRHYGWNANAETILHAFL